MDGSFVTMETVTFEIKSLEKYLFGFNHSNYVAEAEFFKKTGRTSILATCYNIHQFLLFLQNLAHVA